MKKKDAKGVPTTPTKPTVKRSGWHPTALCGVPTTPTKPTVKRFELLANVVANSRFYNAGDVVTAAQWGQQNIDDALTRGLILEVK